MSRDVANVAVHMDTMTVASTGLTCGICGELYVEPRLLPCLHTYCQRCIEGLERIATRRPPKANIGGGHGPLQQVNSLGSSKNDSAVSGYETDKSNASPTDSLVSGVFRSASTAAAATATTTTTTILCPKCDFVVELPADGVSRLPLDYILHKKIVKVSLQTKENLEPASCDLCVGHIRAIVRCFDCSVSLCGFCSEAHKRQRATSGHRTSLLNRLRHGAETSSPSRPSVPSCSTHPMEELRLYCKMCGVTCCRDCVAGGSGQHERHDHCPVTEVAEDRLNELRNFLQRAASKREATARNLNDVRATSKRVQARHAEVVGEINDHYDRQVDAIEHHRRSLNDKVTSSCEIKQRVLQSQSVQLERTLDELATATDFVRQLLDDGTDVEIVTLLGHVGHRIRQLGGGDEMRIEPRVDAFLQFVCNESGGFAVDGMVTTQRISPRKCTVKGTIEAKQGHKCDVLLVTKDAEGQPMRHGGAHPQAELVSKQTPNRAIPLKVIDRKDGAYQLTFKPDAAGLFFLSIKIDDKHVQGSPYPVPVKGVRRKVHTGIYHCCVFCSSAGSKDVKCGCRGTMLGGFKGCGHGHDGHPGKRHWSCCGETDETSDCTRPEAKILHVTL